MNLDRDFWRSRRVCVTGGTGFLGFHLVRQLRTLGARVRVVALEPAATHPIHTLNDVETAYGDIRAAAHVRGALDGCDLVFHTAGVVGFWGPALERMHSVHVEGTRNVLAGAPARARIVHTSSIVAVAAAERASPATEVDAFNLDRLDVDYVHAKRAAEQLALQAAYGGRNVVVVNPSFLIGPEDHEGAGLTRLCQRFWKGRVLLAPPGGINLVDVRDVATGHLRAAERGQIGRRYLLGGEDHTFASFFTLLAEAAGMRPRALPRLPWWLLRLAASAAELRARWTGKQPYPAIQHARLNRFHWYCSPARAHDELGYVSRGVRASLRDLYDWCYGDTRIALRGLNRWWLRPDVQRRAA